MQSKAYAAMLFVLLGGAAARAELVDCEHFKSSQGSYELTRNLRVNGASIGDRVSVSRDSAGRTVAIATRLDGSGGTKTTSQGIFAVEQGSASGTGEARKFEYSGVDLKTFPLDRPATYTMTQISTNGQKVSFRVEYTFDRKMIIAWGNCRLDVVRYNLRRFNLADSQEVSSLEGEYSPELRLTLNSRGRVTAQGQEMSVITIAMHLKIGSVSSALTGGARGYIVQSPQPASQLPQSKGQAPQPGAQPPQEFSVGSIWEYRQQAVAPGRIFAHGQADIVDPAGAQIGGVGFYCAVPHSYVDIYVRKPGAGLGNYLWGNATLKTSLKLNGVSMPAKVERGIIFIDIDAAVRPVLNKAFELGAGAGSQRIDVDVANFAKFALIMKANKPSSPSPPAVAVSYARMVNMCDATIGEQPRSAQ